MAACSGIQHEMPQTSVGQEKAALSEIRSHTLSNNSMSSDAAQQMLFDVYAQLKPAAYDVCTHVNESRHCAWQVLYVESEVTNAVAAPGNQVMVTHGMIETLETRDELAFVLGHELSHHIADHLDETGSQITTGAIIGAAAMAAATRGAAACTNYACQQGLSQAAQGSIQLGGQLGGHVFSKNQEKEADYLSAYMLNLAGFDLDTARLALVKIGAITGKEKTSVADTHPAGPERLASYDELVRVIRDDRDGFPGEDVEPPTEASAGPEPAGNSGDPAGRKCRIYLPEDDICIY